MAEADTATFDYAMPSLGADMDDGRVLEWHVAPGDTVHRGDLVALVETEKSDIDIEIWHDGIVDEFLVDVGDLVAVGTPIVRLRTLGGEPPPSSAPAPVVAPATRPDEAAEVVSAVTQAATADAWRPPAATSGGRVPASPLARRRAVELGVDLGEVRGSGPGGAVVEADVIAASTRPAAAAPSPATASPRRSADTMRTMIAERMATANREIPHYHLTRDLDLGSLDAWLTERNAERSIAERILPAACFVRAVALAAARHPELNGFWSDGRFEPADTVNVAMAISLRRGGLVTPKIERADERSVDEVMTALRELVAAARTGSLRASWMTGATITVTHLGDTGADLVHGVISPPQVALVGFGRTRSMPWVLGDDIVVRPVVTSSLAADHRATDGAIGSRFLATIADLFDQPEQL
jgi:pyruvate dehydrogenase E2 component (dihydrolipoamide acetyltransferase)